MTDNPFDPKYFFFELPLYTSVKVTEENRYKFERLLDFKGTVDFYNPFLKQESTYIASSLDYFFKNEFYANKSNRPYFWNKTGYATTYLTCTRTAELFVFHVYHNYEEKTLTKIGQYPSIADFHISQVREYDKVLKKEKLREFTKAIGLAANGVGIGSFAYLRRIFEDLIEEAHQKAKNGNGCQDKEYQNARMSEKIDILKDFLPPFLVKNKALYGILSKGIHELEEQDCLNYFEPVKIGIELILDQKLEEFNKKKEEEEAEKRISQISQTLK